MDIRNCGILIIYWRVWVPVRCKHSCGVMFYNCALVYRNLVLARISILSHRLMNCLIKLSGAWCFSKIDLRSRYYQLRNWSEEDRNHYSLAKANDNYWGEKFPEFSKLLQENCEGFPQESSLFNQANSEKYQV